VTNEVTQSAARISCFVPLGPISQWSDTSVDEYIIRELTTYVNGGQPLGNSCPARFVWIRSPREIAVGHTRGWR